MPCTQFIGLCVGIFSWPLTFYKRIVEGKEGVIDISNFLWQFKVMELNIMSLFLSPSPLPGNLRVLWLTCQGGV